MSDFDNPKPEINPELEVLRARLIDPAYLPTHSELKQLFPKKDKYSNKDWIDFTIRNEVYEMLNKEFIEALANYLIERIAYFQSSSNGQPITILELGAGNGRLSHFLTVELEKKSLKDVNIIATDSGHFKIVPNFPVEKAKANREILAKYKPTIVMCSWMPYRTDWTADVRATPSVREYILIGEVGTGNCGDHWKTWGVPMSEEDRIKLAGKVPPYVADGFTRNDLDDIKDLQICRTDSSPDDAIHSYTISFRRKE